MTLQSTIDVVPVHLRDDMKIYRVKACNQYNPYDQLVPARKQYVAMLKDGSAVCSCMQWINLGIPCRHILTVILGMPRNYTFNLRQVHLLWILFNLRQIHLLWILPTLRLDYHWGRPSISLSTEPIPFQDFGTDNAALGPRASDPDDTNSSSTSEPPLDQLSDSMPLIGEPDRRQPPSTPPQLMAEYATTMTEYFRTTPNNASTPPAQLIADYSATMTDYFGRMANSPSQPRSAQRHKAEYANAIAAVQQFLNVNRDRPHAIARMTATVQRETRTTLDEQSAASMFRHPSSSSVTATATSNVVRTSPSVLPLDPVIPKASGRPAKNRIKSCTELKRKSPPSSKGSQDLQNKLRKLEEKFVKKLNGIK